MKHDLIVDENYKDWDSDSHHQGWAKCHRCGEHTWSLCCDDIRLDECPSNQMELFALTDFK